MNVLVYSGPEVIQSSLPILTSTLRSLLLPNYTVQSITQHTLINHPWAPSCALLVIPSFSSTLSRSTFTDKVSKFVSDGGSLLAFSVGAGGPAKGVLALPASYEMGSSGSSASLKLPGSVTVDFKPSSALGLSNGGVETVPVEGSTGDILTSVQSSVPRPAFTNLADRPDTRVLGRYGDGEVAGVSFSFGTLGSGRTTLWAPRLDQPLAAIPSPDPEEEKRRLGFLRECLRECGLELPSAGALPSRVPTPMYFVGAAPIVDTILSRLSVDFAQEPTKELKDQNDTFIVHPSSDASADLPGPDATTLQPKRIIALTGDAFPPREKTPTFDVALYLDELAKGKQKSRDLNDDSDPWPIGAALMYGEVVTSTQTMLDRYVAMNLLRFPGPNPTIVQEHQVPRELAKPSPLPRVLPAPREGEGWEHMAISLWVPPVLARSEDPLREGPDEQARVLTIPLLVGDRGGVQG